MTDEELIQEISNSWDAWLKEIKRYPSTLEAYRQGWIHGAQCAVEMLSTAQREMLDKFRR